MSISELAKELRIPATRLNDIVHGRHGVTADTAFRPAHYLGTTAQFCLNLQSTCELRVAERLKGWAIRKSVNPRKTA
jgi:addiction module HigA family antidote